MDKEKFCDNYCPIPIRYTNTEDPEDVYAECDLEELTECPFRMVDFSTVKERQDES